MALRIKRSNGRFSSRNGAPFIAVHCVQRLSFLQQNACNPVGALRRCRGQQRAAPDFRFNPAVCLRVRVQIAQLIGQELIAQLTHSAQIDLRLRNPVCENFDLSVGERPRNFACKILHLFT